MGAAWRKRCATFCETPSRTRRRMLPTAAWEPGFPRCLPKQAYVLRSRNYEGSESNRQLSSDYPRHECLVGSDAARSRPGCRRLAQQAANCVGVDDFRHHPRSLVRVKDTRARKAARTPNGIIREADQRDWWESCLVRFRGGESC